MGWRFWKRRSTAIEVEDVETDVEVEEVPAEALLEADEEVEAAPRARRFTFEQPPPIPEGDTEAVRSMPDDVEEPAHAKVERVVRLKAAGRRTRLDLSGRGVMPAWIPSLRECAVGYRLAAEAREDDPAGAREFWTAYLELCPEDGDGWFAYGRLLLGERRFEQAWTAFESARAANPEDGLAIGALGYLSGVRGDHLGAIAQYTEAVRLRPRCPDMLSGLMRAQEAAGRTAEAGRTRVELDRLEVEG